MKISVIGGAGFIGQHLVNMLVENGDDVRVLGRKPRHFESAKFEYVEGDFSDPGVVAQFLRDADVVYHLAVTTVPGTSNSRILFDAETNLMGSLQLIHMAAAMGVKRFVFTSSGGSVYGPVEHYRPIPENHPTNPISAHAVSKLAIEKYLDMYYRHAGMNYRVARGANPYGDGQNLQKGQGFIGVAMEKIARNEEIVIWGDGSVVRDFFHVHDFARALFMMRDDNAVHHVYNIGSGEGYSLNTIVDLLRQVTERPVTVRYEAGRRADVPFNRLDISRSRLHLGWEPTVELRDGLKATWKWAQTIANKGVLL